MGLEAFHVKSVVLNNAITRGFTNTTDTFLWGVVALKCRVDPPQMTEEMCDNRKAITSLNGVVYILLSITLVLVSGIVVLLLLSSTPLMHSYTIAILYLASILTCLAAWLIYHIKIRDLLADPIGWGIHDDNIHTTISGKDAPNNLPLTAHYKAKSTPHASTVILTSLACLAVSFVIFLLKHRHTMKHKSYVYSNPDMLKVTTIFGPTNHQNGDTAGDVYDLLSSRRVPDSSPRRKKNN